MKKNTRIALAFLQENFGFFAAPLIDQADFRKWTQKSGSLEQLQTITRTLSRQLLSDQQIEVSKKTGKKETYDLHLKSKMPTDLLKYKHSYIFLNNDSVKAVYYIKYDGEKESAKIKNFDQFESKLKEFKKIDERCYQLNTTQIRELITANGEHVPGLEMVNITIPGLDTKKLREYVEALIGITGSKIDSKCLKYGNPDRMIRVLEQNDILTGYIISLKNNEAIKKWNHDHPSLKKAGRYHATFETINNVHVFHNVNGAEKEETDISTNAIDTGISHIHARSLFEEFNKGVNVSKPRKKRDKAIIGYSAEGLPFQIVVGGENTGMTSFIEKEVIALISNYIDQLKSDKNCEKVTHELIKKIYNIIKNNENKNMEFTMSIAVSYTKNNQTYCTGFGIGDTGMAIKRKKTGKIEQLVTNNKINESSDIFCPLPKESIDTIIARNSLFTTEVFPEDELTGYTFLHKEIELELIDKNIKKYVINTALTSNNKNLFENLVELNEKNHKKLTESAVNRKATETFGDDAIFSQIIIPNSTIKALLVSPEYYLEIQYSREKFEFDNLLHQIPTEKKIIRKSAAHLYNTMIYMKKNNESAKLLIELLRKATQYIKDNSVNLLAEITNSELFKYYESLQALSHYDHFDNHDINNAKMIIMHMKANNEPLDVLIELLNQATHLIKDHPENITDELQKNSLYKYYRNLHILSMYADNIEAEGIKEALIKVKDHIVQLKNDGESLDLLSEVLEKTNELLGSDPAERAKKIIPYQKFAGSLPGHRSLAWSSISLAMALLGAAIAAIGSLVLLGTIEAATLGLATPAVIAITSFSGLLTTAGLGFFTYSLVQRGLANSISKFSHALEEEKDNLLLAI